MCTPMNNLRSPLQHRSRTKLLYLFIFYLTLSAQAVLASPPITVGIYNNKPTIFVDESGRPAGIFIDILEEIASKEHWEITYRSGYYNDLLNQLKDGEIDILPAVPYSKQQEKFFDFNNTTVLASWAELYTSEGSEIGSLPGLKDKIIGVKAGDIHFEALKDTLKKLNIKCRFFETDAYVTTFAMLRAKIIDIAAVNRLYGENNKLSYSVKGTSILFNPIEMRYALAKGTQQNISQAMDRYISKFKADKSSIYYRTMNKWLNVDSKTPAPSGLLLSFYAALALTLFLSATLILFRLQVRNRTTELQRANKELIDQVSERHKAEETLQMFARVIEASSDAIAIINSNNKHIFTNISYQSIVTPLKKPLEGTSIIDFLGEDFYNLELKEGVNRCLSGETLQIQTRPRPGHNNDFYWNLTLSPYYSDANKLEGYVMNIQDVTEQVELQNRLKNSQKMEAIGMLAGGVAHDLNNILSGLVSYPDMLLIDRGPEDPMTTPLQTIKKAGERAATIVQDLLTLARRGVGHQVVTNFNTIIREFLISPEHRSITKPVMGVEYIISLDSELSNIKGSTVHLSKILMNFFTNGVEAMLEGGVLTISTKAITLKEEYAGYEIIPPGQFATLTVSDTGIGMSTGEINRVFEPFYTSKVMGRSGTGLGMAVVWGTIKDHDGYINIKSKPGKGTSFTAYFPVTNEPIREQTKSPLHDFLGNKERILIVDDLEEQRVLTHSILESLNYQPETASSGLEAIEKCKNTNYALLVLDMIMPGEYDGLAAFEIIKATNPQQKAIIVSGFSETSRVKQAQAIGAGAYLKKPYTVDLLATTIYNELQDHS